MKLFIALLISLIASACHAQQCIIRGVIKDSSGNPVSFVSIQETLNRGNGASSHADGSFSVRIQKGQTIRSTRLGYGSFQYTVHSDAILEIILPVEPLVTSEYGFSQPGIKKGYVIMEIESRSYIIPPVQTVKFLQERELIEDPNKVFEKVEVSPSFRGGMAAFCRYLGRGVKGTKEKGSIQLKFFIGTSGYTDNVEVLRSYSKKFDKKVISVLKKTIWVPAIQNGRNVGVWCIMDLDVTKNKGKTVFTLK